MWMRCSELRPGNAPLQIGILEFQSRLAQRPRVALGQELVDHHQGPMHRGSLAGRPRPLKIDDARLRGGTGVRRRRS